MTVYDSFAAWIDSFLACMGACLGHCAKLTRPSPVEDPSKGLQCHGQVVEKPSFSEDFWGTSTGDIDCPIDLSQRSFCSLSTSSLSLYSDLGSASTNSHNEFTNHGLLLWNQNRLKWIRGTKSSSQSHQTQGPTISMNATYDSLLSSKDRFRRPVPLPEMIDFLVDIWEEEGLYD